ncbi:MAG: HTH domain-containing protein [archaeon]|nr:HTH domain-containing protein [archaeon]MCP8306915.1 HTH domain-containing protein [archaeon]
MRECFGASMVHKSSDRNLSIALSELSRLADKLYVSDFVVEHAAYTYHKALGRGLVRGRSISGMISASLYEACQNTNTPRTLKDVAKIVNMKKKDLAKYYCLLVRELGLAIPVVDPVKWVSRIASRAKLSERTQRRAFEILNVVKESKTSAGKDPMGLAASALYLASTMAREDDHTVTQKDIAEAAGVTEVTIRNRIKGLKHLWILKEGERHYSI